MSYEQEQSRYFPPMTEEEFIASVRRLGKSGGSETGLKDALWDLVDRFLHADCTVYTATSNRSP